jgi:nucleoside-diphosphate-sugar epimerase
MNDVLVTGGTGHVGSDIVRLLKARGDRVRVLARTHGQDPDVVWIRGDLSTGAGISEAVAGADTVVHAAG